jgi:hypothetical protein
MAEAAFVFFHGRKQRWNGIVLYHFPELALLLSFYERLAAPYLFGRSGMEPGLPAC